MLNTMLPFTNNTLKMLPFTMYDVPVYDVTILPLFLCFLGSAGVKAARKMLVKSTPGLEQCFSTDGSRPANGSWKIFNGSSSFSQKIQMNVMVQLKIIL